MAVCPRWGHLGLFPGHLTPASCCPARRPSEDGGRGSRGHLTGEVPLQSLAEVLGWGFKTGVCRKGACGAGEAMTVPLSVDHLPVPLVLTPQHLWSTYCVLGPTLGTWFR